MRSDPDIIPGRLPFIQDTEQDGRAGVGYRSPHLPPSRQTVHLADFGTLSPDFLVVDTFPSGSFDELFQILDGPFRKGFIFRNVKEDYSARPIFRAALSLYDTIVVPHREDERYPVALAPGVPVHYSVKSSRWIARKP